MFPLQDSDIEAAAMLLASNAKKVEFPVRFVNSASHKVLSIHCLVFCIEAMQLDSLYGTSEAVIGKCKLNFGFESKCCCYF